MEQGTNDTTTSSIKSKEERLREPRYLARVLSLVENEIEGYKEWLIDLAIGNTPVIGVTGPPGAGKSTLVSAMIGEWVSQDKSVCVLAVDPSSPFNRGSLLGDRIRMSPWYLNDKVFIRSMASRGSLGGLSNKIVEMLEVVKTAGFDYIIVETVGVGQSEVEIAGLADYTVVVLVPEGGDDVQGIKAGVMEIADLYVVNKSDRPGAGAFMSHLKRVVAERSWNKEAEVLAVVAQNGTGVPELTTHIEEALKQKIDHTPIRSQLLAEKAQMMIKEELAKGYSLPQIREEVEGILRKEEGRFNLRAYVQKKLQKKLEK